MSKIDDDKITKQFPKLLSTAQRDTMPPAKNTKTVTPYLKIT